MADQFNILDYTEGPLLKTGQTTDLTPAGRTTKDDGGFQKGVAGSKDNAQYNILTTGQYSGTTNITVNTIVDAHSNECVQDKVTGLMWSRNVTPFIYGTGAQGLLWDDTAGSNEDIFNYIDQANISELSGFSDWRVANMYEQYSILDLENGATANPNTTAFPVMPVTWFLSSTSSPSDASKALRVSNANAQIFTVAKTTDRHSMMLCRLGVK